MTLLLLLASCAEEAPELLHFTFVRLDCARECVGIQEMFVPAEFWGSFGKYGLDDTPTVFSYAGMELYSPRWDGWFQGGYSRPDGRFDAMWGVADPWCDGYTRLDTAIDRWPTCGAPFDTYPPTLECL